MPSQLDNYSNPWATEAKQMDSDNYMPQITQDDYNPISQNVLSTSVFENDGEVLGNSLVKNNSPQTSELNFKGDMMIMDFSSKGYEFYWTFRKRYELLTHNPYQGGEDYDYNKTGEDEFLLGESEEFKNIIREQKLIWKKQLQKEGESLDNVVISDKFLFNQMVISFGLIAGVIDSADITDPIGAIFKAASNIRANLEILNRYWQNNDEEFEVPELIQTYFANDEKTKKLVKQLTSRFKELMIESKCDIRKINSLGDWIPGTHYNVPDYKFNIGNTKAIENIVIGGVQGLQLHVHEFETEIVPPDLRKGQRIAHLSYYAKLSLKIIDDFGLNASDIDKQSSGYLDKYGRPFLIAFWILQHQRGIKPFANIVTLPFTTHGRIEI